MKEIFKKLKLTLGELGLEHLIRYVSDIENSIDKIHIAFVGEYNAGKSSLINTLLGRKILAERDLPTTNRVVLVQDCEIEKREKLDPYTERICINEPKLENMVLVDTPGLSSAVKEHETALFKYLHKADLLVFVAPSNQPYTKELENLLKELFKKHSTQLAYVINIFEDPSVYKEDPKKIDRLKQFVREKLSNFLSSEDLKDLKIFAFSVKKVQQKKTSNKQDKSLNNITREYFSFEKFIFEDLAQKAQKLKFASVKEKLLKLLNSDEVNKFSKELRELEKNKAFYEREKNQFLELSQRLKIGHLEDLENKLTLFFEEVEKDIVDVLQRYSLWDFLKDSQIIKKEIEEIISMKFLVENKQEEFSNLLDYRPNLVKLKELFPNARLEPTIPQGLKLTIENLKKDLKEAPYNVGTPGQVAKYVLILALLLIVASGIGVFIEPQYKLYFLTAAGFFTFVFLGALLRTIRAKEIFKERLLKKLNYLKNFHLKRFKNYYESNFEARIEKAKFFYDKTIDELSLRINHLNQLLKKLEELKKQIREF